MLPTERECLSRVKDIQVDNYEMDLRYSKLPLSHCEHGYNYLKFDITRAVKDCSDLITNIRFNNILNVQIIDVCSNDVILSAIWPETMGDNIKCDLWDNLDALDHKGLCYTEIYVRIYPIDLTADYGLRFSCDLIKIPYKYPYMNICTRMQNWCYKYVGCTFPDDPWKYTSNQGYKDDRPKN